MFKRDKDFVQKSIQKKEDGYYTTKKTIIEFPKWFEDKGLYEISDSTYLFGIFAMIVDDKYSVCRIPTVISTTPLMVKEVEREDGIYIQLYYGPGDKIINATEVLMQPYMSYEYFHGFFMMANVPWYVNYEDMTRIMDNTGKYANNNLGRNEVANEVLTSFVSRTEKDKKVFFRTDPKGNPYYVGLMDVRFSTLSTLNKLAGNYPEESLVSALINKEKHPTTLENHARR